MKVTKNNEVIMKKLYESGVSIAQLSNAYNIAPATVRYHVDPKYKLHKQGAYLRKLAMYNEDKDVIRVVTNYLDSIRVW